MFVSKKMIRLPEDDTKTRDERLIGVPEFVARDIVALWQPGTPYNLPLLSGNHRRAYRHAAGRIGYTKTITLRDLRHSGTHRRCLKGCRWSTPERRFPARP